MPIEVKSKVNTFAFILKNIKDIKILSSILSWYLCILLWLCSILISPNLLLLLPLRQCLFRFTHKFTIFLAFYVIFRIFPWEPSFSFNLKKKNKTHTYTLLGVYRWDLEVWPQGLHWSPATSSLALLPCCVSIYHGPAPLLWCSCLGANWRPGLQAWARLTFLLWSCGVRYLIPATGKLIDTLFSLMILVY